MQDLEYVYNTFADIAEAFDEEVSCEVEGHGQTEGLGVIHTDTPVEWREVLVCPACSDKSELLVCDGMHRFILEKIIEKNEGRVLDCECGASCTISEVYVRSVRWG